MSNLNAKSLVAHSKTAPSEATKLKQRKSYFHF
jgi:hypothetical protein